MTTPDKYSAAIDLYREWNERINVISRKDIDNIYRHHILHSLSIAGYLKKFYPDDYGAMTSGSGVCTVLDLGCGGGFPGIPLAMELPGARFTLCDSIGKKVKVASEVARGLGLTNVECVNARAETLSGPYDWVVSRAVTSLVNFYPWVRGKFTRSILYLKGGDVNAEISELVKVHKVPARCIRTWKIADYITNDDYFAEKFVIEIGKNYLCTPKTE